MSLCPAAVDLAGFKEFNSGNRLLCQQRRRERASALPPLKSASKKRKKGRRNRDRKVPIALGGEEKRVKVCPAPYPPAAVSCAVGSGRLAEGAEG